VRVRILIVEDHPLFARALREEILRIASASAPEIAFAATSDAALAAASVMPYDLVLMDLKVPGNAGLVLLRGIQKTFNTKVAVITANDDPSMVRAIYAERAVGYLWKAAPAEQFREGLFLLLAGAAVFPDYVYARSSTAATLNALTDRELSVLRLLIQGLQNKEIARELEVSVATVKTHVKNVFAKLGVKSRLAAAFRAREIGLFSEASRP
jgi:DNA-binding NarL/FixJ family response regulator